MSHSPGGQIVSVWMWTYLLLCLFWCRGQHKLDQTTWNIGPTLSWQGEFEFLLPLFYGDIASSWEDFFVFQIFRLNAMIFFEWDRLKFWEIPQPVNRVTGQQTPKFEGRHPFWNIWFRLNWRKRINTASSQSFSSSTRFLSFKHLREGL